MYIKFFSNKKGGSKASINYLLDDRVTNGTAKVLKGNADFTKAIVGEITNKQKVCMGSINLKVGESLTDAEKEQIMQDFEKTLLPGLSETQYNILWVQHTDKGRIELNFVIPKIELTTKKALQPYYHKQDFSRIDMFEDICNIKYNLESKKDPANAQTLQGEQKDINLVKDYKELDATLHQLVQERQIHNREHLVSLLKENGIKVTRSNKEGISVKLPESKKARRLKGGIYNEQFTSIEELETISEETDRRIKEFQSRDASRELEQTIRKLDKYNEQKAQYNRAKYKPKDGRDRGAKQEQVQLQVNDLGIAISPSNRTFSRDTISGTHSKIQKQNEVDSTYENEISRREQEVCNEREPSIQCRQDSNIHQDRGIEDDTRRRTLKRIRERAEKQERDYADARRARAELYKTVTTDAKKLRAKYEQNSIELSSEYATVTRQSRELVRRVKEVAQKSESSVQFSSELNRTTTARKRITNTFSNFIDKIREFGADVRDKFQKIIQQSESTTRTARELVEYKEQQQSRRAYNRGFSMSM